MSRATLVATTPPVLPEGSVSLLFGSMAEAFNAPALRPEPGAISPYVLLPNQSADLHEPNLVLWWLRVQRPPLLSTPSDLTVSNDPLSQLFCMALETTDHSPLGKD